MLVISVVLAAVTAVPPVPQVPVVPAAPPVAAVAPLLARARGALEEAQPALAAAGAELAGLEGLQGPAGLDRLSRLTDLAGVSGVLATGAGDLTLLDGETRRVPPAPWAQGDPGDSLYRAGRRLLNASRYPEAAAAFGDLIRRYPRSTYAADAYYWAAFAQSHSDDDADLHQALALLDQQKARYPNASTRGDSDALRARLLGQLARHGDQDAARQLHLMSGDTARTLAAGCPSDNDDDPRMAALNALLQMDADNAMPLLSKVLERRDACWAPMRRKALFVVSQKHTDSTEDILLRVARNDPDDDVRKQAVFWLSQVHSDRALAALDSILNNSTDEELQEKAIFALSQQHEPRADQALRTFALKPSASADARAKAIFWLGQSHDDGNSAFLHELYGKLTDQDLKEKVIFSMSQLNTAESSRWLMDIALNAQEDVELRKKALFWAGQSQSVALSDLVALYGKMPDKEVKEQLIFVYSQRHEPAAVDELIDIAKHETDPDLRKKAIFWLGQSHDPRAAQALMEIITQ
ncbi:MAG TPA: HEAT repeat domain-containing protein [Gemmatimonadales bacterium]|nr:HEAT repeat domain-containing protein [Gemmatimonadales bacterium]